MHCKCSSGVLCARAAIRAIIGFAGLNKQLVAREFNANKNNTRIPILLSDSFESCDFAAVP